jgi:hypothetical protein
MTRLISFVLMLFVSSAAFACPMCKDSVPSNDAQSAAMVPGGLNLSIYFMLGGLFCMIGMVSWTLVKGARSANPTARRGFPVLPDQSDPR